MKSFIKISEKNYLNALEHISKYKSTKLFELIIEIQKWYNLPTNIQECIQFNKKPIYEFQDGFLLQKAILKIK